MLDKYGVVLKQYVLFATGTYQLCESSATYCDAVSIPMIVNENHAIPNENLSVLFSNNPFFLQIDTSCVRSIPMIVNKKHAIPNRQTIHSFCK